MGSLTSRNQVERESKSKSLAVEESLKESIRGLEGDLAETEKRLKEESSTLKNVIEELRVELSVCSPSSFSRLPCFIVNLIVLWGFFFRLRKLHRIKLKRHHLP